MIKITRRMVDPITFVERMGIEFIPRIEDSVLDDQLAISMSYQAPRNMRRTIARPNSPPPPPPPLPSQERRPPTPPKQRGKINPNAPRNPSLSPGVQRKLSIGSTGGFASPGGPFMSPRTSAKRKSLTLNLSQISEHTAMNEMSMTDLDALQTSASKLELQQAVAIVKSVRFSDEIDLTEISRMRNSVIAEIFWRSDELANFRYEAFMEAAGLDIEDFD